MDAKVCGAACFAEMLNGQIGRWGLCGSYVGSQDIAPQCHLLLLVISTILKAAPRPLHKPKYTNLVVTMSHLGLFINLGFITAALVDFM